MKILSRLTIFAGVIHISLSAVEIKTFDNFLFGDGNFDDDVQNNVSNYVNKEILRCDLRKLNLVCSLIMKMLLPNTSHLPLKI